MTDTVLTFNQTRDLNWLKSVVPYYATLFRTAPQYTLQFISTDERGAWAADGYSLYFVPKEASDLSALADDYGIVSVFPELPAPIMSYPDVSAAFHPERGEPLWEGHPADMRGLLIALIAGKEDAAHTMLERLPDGTLEFRHKDGGLTTMWHINRIQSAHTAPLLTYFNARRWLNALKGMRGKNVAITYDPAAREFYFVDDKGRTACVMAYNPQSPDWSGWDAPPRTFTVEQRVNVQGKETIGTIRAIGDDDPHQRPDRIGKILVYFDVKDGGKGSSHWYAVEKVSAVEDGNEPHE